MFKYFYPKYFAAYTTTFSFQIISHDVFQISKDNQTILNFDLKKKSMQYFLKPIAKFSKLALHFKIKN